MRRAPSTSVIPTPARRWPTRRRRRAPCSCAASARSRCEPGARRPCASSSTTRSTRSAAALVVGADGRASSMRRQLGLPLTQTVVRTMVAGLLVEGLDDWPVDRMALGTEDDLHDFVMPRHGGTGPAVPDLRRRPARQVHGSCPRSVRCSTRSGCAASRPASSSPRPPGRAGRHLPGQRQPGRHAVCSPASCSSATPPGGTTRSSARGCRSPFAMRQQRRHDDRWRARTGPPTPSPGTSPSGASGCAGCDSAPSSTPTCAATSRRRADSTDSPCSRASTRTRSPRRRPSSRPVAGPDVAPPEAFTTREHRPHQGHRLTGTSSRDLAPASSARPVMPEGVASGDNRGATR